MSWARAQKQDLDGLAAFLRGAEWRAVPLSSRVCRRGKAVLPSRLEASVLVHRQAPGKPVDGALLLTAAGLLLPVLRPHETEPEDPHPKFPNWRGLKHSLHSVMGPLREVLWVEQSLPMRPRVSIDYHLMMLPREEYRRAAPPLLPHPPGLRFRSAAPEDARALYPLQRDYELEEVVVSPGRFSEQACLANLKQSLRHQVVIMAELEGRAVAKAGTNARGFSVDQIGGVFTVESERNRGIGLLVMLELLERIFAEKEMATLFVKKGNLPALALYRKLGFRTPQGYRISYYQS